MTGSGGFQRVEVEGLTIEFVLGSMLNLSPRRPGRSRVGNGSIMRSPNSPSSFESSMVESNDSPTTRIAWTVPSPLGAVFSLGLSIRCGWVSSVSRAPTSGGLTG